MEWRASHILVKEKGLAVELRKRLKSGGKFEPESRRKTHACDVPFAVTVRARLLLDCSHKPG